MPSPLYPANSQSALPPEIFASPPSEYRGTPFWAWNNKLDPAQLCRQLDVFKEMGLGGGHMHSRTGLDTPYLNDEFMACVKTCVEKCRAEGMLAWLYDEDRWPSGAAGGLVTQDLETRACHLLFTPKPYCGDVSAQSDNSVAAASRSEEGTLLARYAVVLKDGYLASYRRLADGEDGGEDAVPWYAYLEVARPSTWFNNQTYVDTLNPKAIQRFIEVTHERYKEVVGDYFGSVVPAIFTDEPQFSHKGCLPGANARRDVTLPYTSDLPETYRTAYDAEFLDTLPEVIWELPEGQTSVARYRYHDHIAERFASAFADQIGNWCEANNIMLTGHLMEENSLVKQTRAVGEAMRSYRSFQLPGIDMLCDWNEYSTAKQAQSAAHQYGRPGVLSELYGVTGWDFDFAGHKRQGDWQAALGVTVRVHHLSWVSMGGEAKRDYPASISYQSPWWKQYRVVEDHFARVNAVLTRGKPIVRIGVLHPVESFWLCFGPMDQTVAERDERDSQFDGLIHWLLGGQLDFDFIAESLLPSQFSPASSPTFNVGQMAYEAVLVPSMKTIRSTTLDCLESFVDAGGRLIFAGEIPSLVDAVPSERASILADRCECIAMGRSPMLKALQPLADVKLTSGGAQPAKTCLYQLREEGDLRYLFVCNTSREPAGNVRVDIAGEWKVTLLDTTDGSQTPLPACVEQGRTVLQWKAAGCGHLLLQLDPGAAEIQTGMAAPDLVERGRLEGPISISLDEPNTLVLDQPEWRLEGGDWQPREEMLRIHNRVRRELDLAPQQGHIVQPWIEHADPTVLGQVQLRFALHCEVQVDAPLLAVEQPEDITLTLDGSEVPVNAQGWWVDESIRTVSLPSLSEGKHELIITRAYHSRSNMEWCYLLGDFGVFVRGRDATITAPVRQLAFGDWSSQGLPFYTGNVTYHCRLEGRSEEISLQISKFEGACATVKVDDERVGTVAFPPYRLGLGKVVQGEHALDVTLYGTRGNAFGPLHSTVYIRWQGPTAWRTTGQQWGYEYNLKPMGILSAPIVESSR